MFKGIMNFFNNNNTQKFNYYYKQSTNTLIKTLNSLNGNDIIEITEELYKELFGKPYQLGFDGLPVLPKEPKPHDYYYWNVERQSWLIDDDKEKELFVEFKQKCLDKIKEISSLKFKQINSGDVIENACKEYYNDALNVLSDRVEHNLQAVSDSNSQSITAGVILRNCTNFNSNDELTKEAILDLKKQDGEYQAKLLKLNKARINTIDFVNKLDKWNQLKNFLDELNVTNDYKYN